MEYDLVKRADDLAKYNQRFCLSPEQWIGCKVVLEGEWQSVRFQPDQRGNVPKERGLYAFVLRPAISGIFELGYLMYLGQTGHGSARTLHDRFGDYLQPSKVRKRTHIARMMEKWQDYLVFYFIKLKDATNLKALEAGLNDALIPPFVTSDYSIQIRAAVRAFQ